MLRCFSRVFHRNNDKCQCSGGRWLASTKITPPQFSPALSGRSKHFPTTNLMQCGFLSRQLHKTLCLGHEWWEWKGVMSPAEMAESWYPEPLKTHWRYTAIHWSPDDLSQCVCERVCGREGNVCVLTVVRGGWEAIRNVLLMAVAEALRHTRKRKSDRTS